MAKADNISLPQLWNLSWPLVATMFLQFSVGLADVYVAGRFAPAVQGAVGFASQLLFFFTAVANGLGVGIVAVAGRFGGRSDTGKLWHAIRQALLITTLAAVPLSLLGLALLPTPLIGLLLPSSVASAADTLLPFYILSLLPQALLSAAAAIYRTRMEMRTILLCSGLTSLLNLLLDFVLPFGLVGLPAMGPPGIALATAIGSYAGVILAVALLFKRGMAFFARRLDLPLARSFWRFGWPIGVLQIGWQLGSLALYTILGKLPNQSVAATAALTNGLRIEAILYLPAFALNMVTAVLVARALGENDSALAERTGWRIAAIAATVLSLMALPVFIYSRQLAALLSPDPAVRHLTHLYLRFNMLSQPFMAASVIIGGALDGAGAARSTMKAVLSSFWAFRIPLAVLLALVASFGANGVWGAMVLSMVLQFILLAHYFRKGDWKGSSTSAFSAP